MFSWTESVDSEFARASSVALHRTLIEIGSTTKRAHQVVAKANLSSYPDTVDPEAPTDTASSTLVLGADGNGPTIENLDVPDTTDAEGKTVTVEMQPGATVRVDIRDDADYLPVALRVEGIDSWTATEGTPTGKWGEYRVVLREDGTYTGHRDEWQFGTSTPEGDLRSGESGECVAPDRSRRAAPIPAPKASPTPPRSRAKTRCSLRSTTA